MYDAAKGGRIGLDRCLAFFSFLKMRAFLFVCFMDVVNHYFSHVYKVVKELCSSFFPFVYFIFFVLKKIDSVARKVDDCVINLILIKFIGFMI